MEDLNRIAKSIEQRHNWMPGEIFTMLMNVYQHGKNAGRAEVEDEIEQGEYCAWQSSGCFS